MPGRCYDLELIFGECRMSGCHIQVVSCWYGHMTDQRGKWTATDPLLGLGLGLAESIGGDYLYNYMESQY